MRKSIEATIEEIVQPIVDAKNFEIVDIEYVKEAGEYYLRVYLDKEGGISLTDCEEVSRALSEVLDAKDPIKENYFLDDGAYLITKLLIELARGRKEGYTLESLIESLRQEDRGKSHEAFRVFCQNSFFQSLHTHRF